MEHISPLVELTLVRTFLPEHFRAGKLHPTELRKEGVDLGMPSPTVLFLIPICHHIFVCEWGSDAKSLIFTHVYSLTVTVQPRVKLNLLK